MQKKEDVGRVGACGAAFEGHEAHTKLVASGEQCLLGAAALGRFYCSAFKDELTRALLTFTYTLTYTPIEAYHAQCIGKQGHISKRLAKASQPAHQQSRTACHAAGGFDDDKRGTSWRSRKRERVSQSLERFTALDGCNLVCFARCLAASSASLSLLVALSIGRSYAHSAACKSKSKSIVRQ